MAYLYNPDDGQKNLGLGAGMNMSILRAPTALRGPSGPTLNLPNFQGVNFLSNKDKAQAVGGTPTVMGYPDENGAASPNLMSSPASLANRGKTYNERVKDIRNQIGITGTFPEAVEPSPRENFYEKMGPVPRYTPYEMIDMYSKEKAYDYIGRISDDDAKKIDPRGKQGLLDYLVESLKKRKIRKPPTQYPWRESAKAPERDWGAISDFQNFVGMRSGRTRDVNVDKALQNPGMADQSFGGSLTLKQVTPEMIATLKAEGYNVEQADYMKNAKLGMLKTGSGSAALNLYKTLKAKGYDLEIQPFKQVSYR